MRRFKSFLIFFIPFVLFFFYFTNQNDHNSTSASHMEHEMAEIPEDFQVPSVDLSVIADRSGSWVLRVHTDHFAFAPEKAGEEKPSYNEGHAHLFVNGKKVTRLYGAYYYIRSLDKGVNVIKVTLNSNNHKTLAYNGQPIQKEIVVENHKRE